MGKVNPPLPEKSRSGVRGDDFHGDRSLGLGLVRAAALAATGGRWRGTLRDVGGGQWCMVCAAGDFDGLVRVDTESELGLVAVDLQGVQVADEGQDVAAEHLAWHQDREA